MAYLDRYLKWDPLRDLDRRTEQLLGQSTFGNTGSAFSRPDLTLFNIHNAVTGTQASSGNSLTSFNVHEAVTGKQASDGGSSAGGEFSTSTGRLPEGNGVLRWSSLINAASQKYGVPAAVIAAIIERESSGDPNATSEPANAKGERARGLMQIMDFHWAPGENKYDPQLNIDKGTRLLKENYDRAARLYPGRSEAELWNAAAAAYLGDWDWQRGTYAGFSDVYGMNGPEYVRRFNESLQKYQAMIQENGSLGSSASGADFRVGALLNGAPYRLTQGYGQTDWARNSGMYASGFHDGIDIGVASGTRLSSPGQGTVVMAGLYDGYGGTVQIRLANGYTIQFSHLRKIDVQEGQQVDLSTYLGDTGGNANDWGHGASTGAHLHIRLLDPNGNSVDPRQLIQL